MRFIFLVFLSSVFLFVAKTNTTKMISFSTETAIKHKDSCAENLIFKSNFLKSLEYIEACVEGGKSNKKEFGNSIDNMVRNSGIKSSVYYGYIFRYRKKTDFYTDKKKWLLWYEKNKCKNLKWE